MALKLPYRMRLLVSVGFFMVLCSSVVSYNSSDCKSYYRRDVMETWRFPANSGMCNFTTNCTEFNVTTTDGTVDVLSKYGNTTLGRSFATYRHYSGDAVSVLLDVDAERAPMLVFEVTSNASEYYTCLIVGDDAGLMFRKYVLLIPEGDIIIEGRGIGILAYFIQFFAMIAFMVISVTKTQKFYIASIGYPVFLLSWIIFTGISEMNIGLLLVGIIFIFSITYATIHAVSKKSPQKQNEIAIWSNAILSGLMLVRCSYCGLTISIIACLYMLISFCCMKPAPTFSYDKDTLLTLTNKIKEGNLFMTTWLISLFFQLDAPLPLLLTKYQNMDRAYPKAPGLMMLFGDILVGPIFCFCVGGFIFRYAREFKKESLAPENLAQGYFAPQEYPVYGQPPRVPVNYENQPVYAQQPGFIQNQQANPFM